MMTYNTEKEIAEKICDFIDFLGFTAPEKIDPESLKIGITDILEKNMGPLPEVSERVLGTPHRSVNSDGIIYEV